MADTSTFRTACQLADHLHRPAQGKKAVEAMIADIQAALTVRTDFLLDGEHPLGEGRLQRPAVTHRSHPWLTGRAPLLYTLSPAAPLALYRAVVTFPSSPINSRYRSSAGTWRRAARWSRSPCRRPATTRKSRPLLSRRMASRSPLRANSERSGSLIWPQARNATWKARARLALPYSWRSLPTARHSPLGVPIRPS